MNLDKAKEDAALKLMHDTVVFTKTTMDRTRR